MKRGSSLEGTAPSGKANCSAARAFTSSASDATARGYRKLFRIKSQISRTCLRSAPPYRSDVHPVAFDLSGVTVHWYGILLATGFMVGLWTAGRRGMRIGLNAEDISNLMLWMFIGGIAGAKILYVINHWGMTRSRTCSCNAPAWFFTGRFSARHLRSGCSH